MHESQPKNRAEPHRRLLRHTYQEGPGFLFLATRGGRPPGRAAGLDLAALRFRGRCVRVARHEGLAAALALGASRASLHRWRARYAAGGLEALLDRPRGPQRSHLPTWVEQAVIVVRLLTYWNSKRLAAEFTRREIYPLDDHAVDGIMPDLGTARPSVRRERGPAYERGRPSELWHVREGLDRRPRRRPFPVPDRATCPAPTPGWADPGLARRLRRVCAARRSS